MKKHMFIIFGCRKVLGFEIVYLQLISRNSRFCFFSSLKAMKDDKESMLVCMTFAGNVMANIDPEREIEQTLLNSL